MPALRLELGGQPCLFFPVNNVQLPEPNKISEYPITIQNIKGKLIFFNMGGGVVLFNVGNETLAEGVVSEIGVWPADAEEMEKQRRREIKETKKQEVEEMKAFIEAGGKKLSKAEIEALKNVRNGALNTLTDQTITKLINDGYIRKEGLFLKRYIIEKKGFAILNWSNQAK